MDSSAAKQGRDLSVEESILNRQVEADSSNLLLRKRRDMCRAARNDAALVPDYFEAYPPPRGSSAASRRAKTADYSAKARPEVVPGDEEFVRAWQSSTTVDEAAEKLGIPDKGPWCSSKAGAMRRHGVALKDLSWKRNRKNKLDVDALNSLIESMGEDPVVG